MLAVVALVAGSASARQDGYRSSWEPEKGSLLYKHTRALGEVDRIEVESGSASITQIFDPDATVLLEGEPMQPLITAWRQLDSGNAAACWAPHARLRFYNRERLITQVQICFSCSLVNFAPDPQPGKRPPRPEYAAFDAHGPTGTALRLAIEAAVGEPIPH
jgi:hypothetical protein